MHSTVKFTMPVHLHKCREDFWRGKAANGHILRGRETHERDFEDNESFGTKDSKILDKKEWKVLIITGLAPGIPGMSVGSIDPLYWPKFTHYFSGALITGSVTVREVNFIGWSNLKVVAVRANVKDPDRMVVDLDYKIPQLDIFGRFKGDGKIGVFNFQSDGRFLMNLTDVVGTWKVSGSREKNEPFLEIKSFRGVPIFEGMKLKATGVAVGNERLGEFIVATINRTWKVFHPIAKPAVDREWGNYCKEKLNKLFMAVPYDELFPLNPPNSEDPQLNSILPPSHQ